MSWVGRKVELQLRLQNSQCLGVSKFREAGENARELGQTEMRPRAS